MTRALNPFDRGASEATAYDAWYDSTLGRAVLQVEVDCVRPLLAGAVRPWLDLGTGSGRFGAALGAEAGLDPAIEMLRIAARRVPSVVRGVAEALPFRDASVGAVSSITVFEFLPDVPRTMGEVARILRRGGQAVVGFFPRGSAWASAYEAQGRDPGSVFHGAHFFTLEEMWALAAAAGLAPGRVRSTLFGAPGGTPSGRIVDGVDPAASFVATALVKSGEVGGRFL